MEDIQITSIEKPCVWSPIQISLASFIAGPFAGCYLLGKNFKAFGNPKLCKKLQFTGVIVTFFLVIIFCFLPLSLIERIPKMMIPITYTGAISSFAREYQKNKIKELISNGGKRYSYPKLFLNILLLLLCQGALILVFAMFISFFS